MDNGGFIKQLKMSSMKFQKNYLCKNIKSFPVPVLMALLILTIPGCYTDKEELLYPGSTKPVDCTSTAAKFAADVQPVILSKCAIPGCHDASASGGVILQNYAEISSKKDRVNARAVVERSMPASGTLLPAEIAKIKCWIDGGALNN
jgi:uncharacterized membrane protein